MSRIALTLAAWVVCLVGCTKRNPTYCDTSTECGDQVCFDHTCVDRECTTAIECTSPAPYCADGICLPACAGDADCEGLIDLAHCGASGECVQCTEASHCDPTTPVCEASTCRACQEDAECGSSVCLEAEGTCAATDDVVYVSMSGTDTGDCNEAAPCRTVAFALDRVTSSRRVIRITSLDFVETNGISINRDVYLDGADTRIARAGDGPAVLSISNQAMVTIEHIRIVAAPQQAITVGTADVIAWEVEVHDTFGDAVEVRSAGHLRAHGGVYENSTIKCNGMNGRSVLDIDEARIENTSDVSATISAENCSGSIRRTRVAAAAIVLADSEFDIENNIVSRNAASGPLFSFTSSSGTVRFNTVVHDAPTVNLDPVIECGGGLVPTITSNIFATRSTMPYSSPCIVAHSLFDLDAASTPGDGNQTQVLGAIFADPTSGTYELGPDSLAIGAAESDLGVEVDYNGSARPQPAGTVADVGAIEAP